MHNSSYKNMEIFSKKYLEPKEGLKILDLGSQAVPGQNSSYRELFDSVLWHYVGAGMSMGDNVDVVIHNIYCWEEFENGAFDVVISGQTFEHIEFPWITMMEIMRVLKTGGLACIIAPSRGYLHRFPRDCYRYYEDGMCALAKYAGLEVLDCYTQRDKSDAIWYDPEWQDTVLVCQKPQKDKRTQKLFDKLLTLNRLQIQQYSGQIVMPQMITMQLFIGCGSFTEESSITKVIYPIANRFKVRFFVQGIIEKMDGDVQFRFDPANSPIEIALQVARAVLTNDESVPLVASYHNAYPMPNGRLQFDDDDPQIVFCTSKEFSSAQLVEFEGSFCLNE